MTRDELKALIVRRIKHTAEDLTFQELTAAFQAADQGRRDAFLQAMNNRNPGDLLLALEAITFQARDAKVNAEAERLTADLETKLDSLTEIFG